MPSLFLSILAALLIHANGLSEKSIRLEGKASYYGKSFEGRKTANGEIFRNHDFTAAHRTLPFGTYIRVYNQKNHLSTTVRINDRGPYVNSRIIDLSEAAARRIGSYSKGLASVKLEELNLIRRSKTIDSLFSCEDIMDCLGNPESLQGYSISLWKTKDLVHMVYLANELYLQEPVDKVLVAGIGVGDQRAYHLVLTDFKSRSEALKAIDQYERKGFMKVRLFPANE
jgi:rare lipoprotein A